MPTIIVMSNENANQDSAVVLSENVHPEHLVSNHHAAQLMERVGWAVTDAKEAEVEEHPAPLRRPSVRRKQR